MDLQILVAEYALGTNIVGRALSGDIAVQRPGTGPAVQKGIVDRNRLADGRRREQADDRGKDS